MNVQILQSSQSAPLSMVKKGPSPFSWLFSPLWLFLALALIIRIYLIIHTNAVIDGDDALLGIQAEHILHGERPIYFYGLPYMGSLEAYFTALVFALVGPSSWALRAEPTLLSLLIVALTWKLASDLIKRTSLSTYAQNCFIWSATLVAALLPLYDLVIELRTWGAWVEVFVVMLLLLLAAFHLVVRWQVGAPLKELALRWAGLGFLIGLGFWLYPLVVVAVVASVLWILGGFLSLVVRMRRRNTDQPVLSFSYLSKGLLLSVLALPAALIGGAPALYWGAQNNWANLTFILQLNSHTTSLHQRLTFYENLANLYGTCVGPHVIGGRVTFESGLLYTLHSFTLGLAVFCLGVCIAIYALSFVLHSDLLSQIRRAMALPLLFGLLSIGIFCVSSASGNGLGVPCIQDFVGRYASVIGLALPFFFATTLTAAVSILQSYASKRVRASSSRPQPIPVIGQLLVLALFVAYLGAQLFTYTLSDPGYTFQSPYCMSAPANNDRIIAYLQDKHIKYAWAPPSLAYPITFKTNSNLIVMDPYGAVNHIDWLNRIPANTDIVRKADRPSLLVYVPSSNTHPTIFQLLDRDHITYQSAHFPSELGTDVLVVTPLNRSIPMFSVPDYSGQLGCSL